MMKTRMVIRINEAGVDAEEVWLLMCVRQREGKQGVQRND